MKKLFNIGMFAMVSILVGCNSTTVVDFSDYVEGEYCRTNVEAIKESKYAKVAQCKTVTTYSRNENGEYVEDIIPVFPFDTNLIYTSYSSKDLNTTKDVKDIENAVGELAIKLHKLFDRHYYYLDEDGNLINNLKVLNDNYGKGWIKVDDDLFNVLKDAVNSTKISQGKFNLFIGELSDFWDNYINNINYGWESAEETKDPAQTEDGIKHIEELVADTPTYNEVDQVLEFNDETKEVKFNQYEDAEKVSISLGGIGKGYLAERCYQELKKIDRTNGMYYAGASTIVVMDKNDYGDQWKIRLSNPYGVFYSYVGTLQINEKMSISTSGSQINYYYTIVDGELKLRHHIIDSVSGYPLENFNQVTLISDTLSSSLMDTLSTVFINCPVDKLEDTLEGFRNYYNADIEGVFYSKSKDDTKKEVDVLITKGLKEKGIFIEEKDDGSTTFIPCNYQYLDF